MNENGAGVKPAGNKESEGPAARGGVALVMPIYNEAAHIRDVVLGWRDALKATGGRFQIFAINDGSTDATASMLSACVQDVPELVVETKPNSGHGRSCRLGYERALASGMSWILQVDSDGQSDPRYFPAFWEAAQDTECVFGLRRTRGDGAGRSMITALCRLGVWMVSGVNTVDPNVPYRLMRREVLARALDRIPAEFDLHNVALTLVLRKMPGLRWKWIPIHFPERQAEKSTYNLARIVHGGMRMLMHLRKL
jgi:glycosyltransferase involved in cell wall biosynthesis